MLAVTYRKHGIRLSHVWFATQQDIDSGRYRAEKTDLIFLHGVSNVHEGGTLLSTQHTLIKDISPTEEELFASLGKHLRKHIRKSENEVGARIEFYTSEDIPCDKTVLSRCKFLYEKMFSDKGMSVHFNMKLAKQYCAQGSFPVEFFDHIFFICCDCHCGNCSVRDSDTSQCAEVLQLDNRRTLRA